MATTTDGKTPSEPTMEEILASIRKIIADEKDPAADVAAKPGEEDVLELTQMVQEDGSIVDLSAQPTTPPKEPAMAQPPKEEVLAMPEKPAAPATAAPPPPGAKGPVSDALVSERTAATTSASMASLVSTVQIERMAAAVPMTATPFGQASRTLEDMIEELIKPMLKDWLDQNLTPLVERLVQKEIERIARRAGD